MRYSYQISIIAPLIWLFCNIGANKEINHTHKHVLRMLYEDYECPFEILRTRSDRDSIHANNLQKLMVEIYKSINHLSPSLVREFHEEKCVELPERTPRTYKERNVYRKSIVSQEEKCVERTPRTYKKRN